MYWIYTRNLLQKINRENSKDTVLAGMLNRILLDTRVKNDQTIQ